MVESLFSIGYRITDVGYDATKDVQKNTKKQLKRIRIKGNDEIHDA